MKIASVGAIGEPGYEHCPMDETLADALKARDRERWLAILWAPAAARPALVAIHSYDLEQARIVAEAKEPMLGEIRLAWWRERLADLAAGKPAPPQPILAALQAHALPRGVALNALAALEEGVLPLLLEGPADAAAIAAARGRPLFVALAQALLGGEPGARECQAAEAAGIRFAFAQLLRADWGLATKRLPALPSSPAERIAGPLPGHLRALLALAEDDLARAAGGRPLAAAAAAGRQVKAARAALF